MQIIVTPNTALCHAGEFVVEVDVCEPLDILCLYILLYNLVGVQPCGFHAVVCLVVENAVKVNLCLGRTHVYALHHALYILQHLLAAEIETARCGNVVCSDHHEHLLWLACDVALEVVALLG